jgi:hypothetical protein
MKHSRNLKFTHPAQTKAAALSLYFEPILVFLLGYNIVFIMTNGYHIKNQYAIHFVTFTVVGWVDVFTRKETKDIVNYALSCDL